MTCRIAGRRATESRHRWIEEQLGDGALTRLYELLTLVADPVEDPGRRG